MRVPVFFAGRVVCFLVAGGECFCFRGDMAELADALASGASLRKKVRVRLSLSPHEKVSFLEEV